MVAGELEMRAWYLGNTTTVADAEAFSGVQNVTMVLFAVLEVRALDWKIANFVMNSGSIAAVK